MPTPQYQIPKMSSNYDFLMRTASTAYTIIQASSSATRPGSSNWRLPVPSSLDYGSDYKWSAEELGHVAARVIKSMSAGISSAKNAMNGETNVATKTIASVPAFIDSMVSESMANDTMGMTGKEVQRQLISAISTGLGAGATGQKEYNKMHGVAYNPNEQLYFDGVSLRDFSLSFNLMPLDQEESEYFASYIAYLRQTASPEFTDQSKFYFTYPQFFDVRVIINSLPLLVRARCALTSLKVNLTPSGNLTWHEDGRPTSYSLDFSFKETQVPVKSMERSILLLGK